MNTDGREIDGERRTEYLHLSLPVGLEEANKEVQVTVEAGASGADAAGEVARTHLVDGGKWQGEFEAAATKGSLKKRRRCREPFAGTPLPGSIHLRSGPTSNVNGQIGGHNSRQCSSLLRRCRGIDLRGLP